MANDAKNILTGPVALAIGAAGEDDATAIATAVGYTEDGLQLSYGDTLTDLEVDEEIFAVGATRTAVEITLSFQMAEATLSNLLFAYGLPSSALAGSVLTINPGTDVEQVSLKATGQAPNGGTRTYVFPRVSVRGQRQTAIRKGQKVLIPVELAVYKGTGVGDVPGIITDTPATPANGGSNGTPPTTP
ncbi:hypothetical protein [Candidatus Darwinibacter acetoxidans]